MTPSDDAGVRAVKLAATLTDRGFVPTARIVRVVGSRPMVS